MNTHLLALQLMAVQGCLGAFDTVYHHELSEALPQRQSARRELAIHAIRALIYAAVFVGLALLRWQGAWVLALLGVFLVEIVLTLWDFVIEDRTRLLPATERVTHTLLAMNGGAFIALLAVDLSEPTALVWQTHGWLSVFLVLCGVGVGLSGVRDALAARRAWLPVPAIDFDPVARHVLVSGATGFIGQRLVRALLAEGHRVTVLTRRPKQAAWEFDGKAVCVASMSEIGPSTRIDAIVNLAGARILGWRWNAARKRALLASRVGTTNAIVDWIARAEHKPTLLISGSAIGYYGVQAQDDQRELDESAPAQPIFMSDLCREWEAAARKAGAHGVRVECIRLGLVLGKQGALPMMLLPILLGMGGRLGSGKQAFSWIHVDDVLAGIAHLWRHASGAGAANFTAPEVHTQWTFSQTAARVLHRPCLLPTPAWPVRAMLGEQADLLLEGQRVIPKRLLAEGFRFRYPALEGALRSLQ